MDGIPHLGTRSGSPSAPEWLERMARLGYATKGVVYVIVGVLAVQAAVGTGGSTTGTRGAVLEIARQPFGQILLAFTAVGLFAYAVWRFVEAGLDPRHKGRNAEGVASRLGYAASGAAYLSLSVWTAFLVIGRGGSSGGEGSGQEWTARLMSQPFGRVLVGIAGAVVIGVGLYHLVKAYKATFMQEYDAGRLSATERTWALRIGRFGLTARGIVFCMVGFFLIQAARHASPEETRGLGGALDALAAQPMGPWLLAVVAAGLAAYGVYCFSRARYSRFRA